MVIKALKEFEAARPAGALKKTMDILAYLACERELGWNREIVDVNGSGISLGHPVGCTGARLVVTLLYEMARRDAHRGLATLCAGGGQGFALIVERE